MRHYVHLTGKHQGQALEAIRAAQDAFARGGWVVPDGEEAAEFAGQVSLDVQDGGQQFATLLWRGDMLSLEFRADEGKPRFRVVVLEPRSFQEDEASRPDPDFATATLSKWTVMLESAPSEEARSMMEAARSAAADLAAAAADAYAPGWTHAVLSMAGTGHGSSLFLTGVDDGTQFGVQFLSGDPTPKYGGMTTELHRLFNEVGDTFIHVDGYISGSPRQLRVLIGSPPDIRLENPHDPVRSLRLLSKLPQDARLRPADRS